MPKRWISMPSWRLVFMAIVALTSRILPRTAGPNIDVSKLKPGDKLEYNSSGDEWVVVEYFGKGPGQTLMVNRPPFDRPVSTPISWLRMPRAMNTPAATVSDNPFATEKEKAAAQKNKAPADPNNPFATPEEKSAPPKPRTWTDQSGGFKIEATLVRIEDGKAVLKRTDNQTEVSVPLEKLSNADQKYADDFKAGRPLDAPTGKPEQEIISLTPTNYKSAKELKFAASAWKYEPDPLPNEERLRDVRMKLNPLEFFEHPIALLMLPREKKVFVVTHVDAGDNRNVSRVQACNLASGKVEAAAVFGVGINPIDISEDGTKILGRSAGFFASERRSLCLYSREGNKVKPLCAWEPYANDASKTDPAAMIAREASGVGWASFIDNEHVLTLNENGELVMWQVPELIPLYRTQLAWGAHPTLSGGRKLLFAPYAEGIMILKTANAEIVGTLQSPDHAPGAGLVLRSDGLQMAAVQGERFQIWDLKERKLIRDFYIGGLSSSGSTWIADNLLLVQGQYLVDVDRRIPVWKYPQSAGTYLQRGGRILFAQNTGRDYWLASAEVPDKTVLALAAKLNPDDFIVLRPGKEVTIDLQAGGMPEDVEAAKKSLEEKLQKIGVKSVSQSDLHLVGRIQSGKSVTMSVGRDPFHGGTQVSLTPQVLSLGFELAGDVIWKHEMSSSPPFLAGVKQGESPDQAFQREMQQRNDAINVKLFNSISLPGFLSRLPKTEEKK